MSERENQRRSDPAPCAAVILAAGKSTRMRSRVPKPLHPLCGAPLTRHVIEACVQAGVERIVLVVGHEAELVRAGLGDDVEYVVQPEQLGTGHAAMCAEAALCDHDGPVLVLAGDVPLLRPETLQALVAAATGERGGRRDACATRDAFGARGRVGGAMLVATLDDPTGYGRVVRNADGSVARIVEQKDATIEEAAIREWNPSVYCFEARLLWPHLRRVRSDNAQREYYLTDVVALMGAAGEAIAAVPVADPREVMGVNSRVELAEAEAALRQRTLTQLMLSGVTVKDPATTYVDVGVTVGADTVLEPQTHLRGKTAIGSECVVGPMAVITDTVVGDACSVVASHVSGCVLGRGVRVGPFANLRPGCHVEAGAKIGDFVELKNSHIGEGVSAAHLSYIGDADVGARTNIGAGTITCNYDGYAKHRTVIGEGAFIGSDNILVAPISIGDGAMTAAGSTLTTDVPADDMAIARAPQVNREEWARRWRAAHEKRRADQPAGEGQR